MYAFIANGIQTICQSQRQLEILIALYPYPKFQKCSTAEEARKWLRSNQRFFQSTKFSNYGDTALNGYATVTYEIQKDSIFYVVDTTKIGFLRVLSAEDILIDSRKNMLNITYLNMKLNNDLIAHHVIAIRKILRILGKIIDINLCVPDVSIYLAITKYSGSNYIIKGAQHDIAERLGAVAVTIEEEMV